MPLEAHRVGLRLDRLRERREPSGGIECDRVVAPHVGGHQPDEDRGGPVRREGEIADVIVGQVAALDLGGPGRPGGEEELGQVGTAEPQQEAELQRRPARRGPTARPRPTSPPRE